MEPGDMLEVLAQVEAQIRPLLASAQGWSTLDVDYHPPRVERVFRAWGDGMRICVHRIWPCAPDAPLLHPHPWPAAFRVFGHQEIVLGHGQGTAAPSRVARLRIAPGSTYEMVEPDAWHSVRPLGGPGLSLMVHGAPWDREIPLRPSVPLRPLAAGARDEVLQLAWHAYDPDRRAGA